MDIVSPEARSRIMRGIRSWDTKPERLVRSALHRQGFRFRKHVRELPGKPDIVFPRLRVAVFVDGDFWHGFRFPRWGKKLSPYWHAKIAGNIARDKRNFAALRRRGWLVVRIWEHEVRADDAAVVVGVVRLLKSRHRELVRSAAKR